MWIDEANVTGVSPQRRAGHSTPREGSDVGHQPPPTHQCRSRTAGLMVEALE
jgi:hypothetical protein